MLFWTIVLGCAPSTTEKNNQGSIELDADGDGFFASEDCNDENPLESPAATELCDGIDNNCDGEIDEDVQIVFYVDSDSDGYGNPDITTKACEALDGFVSTGTDCDDTNSYSFPSAPELCDGLDNDCDEQIDEDLDIDFFLDLDSDGFGDDSQIISGCAPDQNLSTVGGDCDDYDPSISPIANELCDEIDNNCNGNVDEGVQNTYFSDTDQDGYGSANDTIEACTIPFGYIDNASDCNDIDSNVHPAAEEMCDQQDNDCDGETDEEGAIGASIWYDDGDNDGFGDLNDTKIACNQPTGYVSNNTDCDDNNGIFHPNATEICNGFDDNCDGTIDELGSADADIWYQDADGDGYGNRNQTVAACSQPLGYVEDNTDCDDQDNDTHPNAVETCNLEDDDCDGEIDEEANNRITLYEDTDGDGYGNTQKTVLSCSITTGYATVSGDCDDTKANAYPLAPEYCDGYDNDCDGNIDENTSIDVQTWFIDYDGDTFGSDTITLEACVAPNGFVSDNTDCNDLLSQSNPITSELCDGIDNDCDGIIDNPTVLSFETYYLDADGDGYGSTTSVEACSDPSGYVLTTGDCDDSNSTISPLSTEICNGFDDNCDGVTDTDAIDLSVWYADTDGDGYGSTTSVEACFQPNGFVPLSTDCDDNNALAYPSLAEICDGIDNDCNGIIDNGILGTSNQCPAASCAELDTNLADGLYWIDPDSDGGFEAYCELSATDGPWTWLVHDGLTAYWTFGGSVTDMIVGYTGTNTGSISSDIPYSGFGQSIFFDNDESTRIDLNSGPSFGSQGSIGWWSKCVSCSNNQIPLMTNDSNGWVADHYYQSRWYHTNTGYILSSNTVVCGDSIWKHNLYTYDGNGVRAYINGSLVEQSTTTPYLSGLSLKYIGSKPGFGTNGLHGNIDDLFFTSEVLDAQDALLIYEQGVQGRPIRWQ